MLSQSCACAQLRGRYRVVKHISGRVQSTTPVQCVQSSDCIRPCMCEGTYVHVCVHEYCNYTCITYHPEDHLVYHVRVCVHVCVCMCMCVCVCVCVCVVAWSSNLGPVVCVK